MAFRQIRFTSNDEEFLALLTMFPFEAFQEDENELIGFIDEEYCDDTFHKDLELLCSVRDVTYQSEVLDDINWNQEWESSFKPVVVNDFCVIKATFHNDLFDVKHVITIDPKMAFGTGHHETTYMMIEAMEDVDFMNRVVLDHGCGTGILSILAEKCGASTIDAIDIEEDSYKNTVENIELNSCNKITPILGVISQLKDRSYDIILANINRKVLLDTVSQHAALLKPGGKLLMSGILTEDQNLILDTYEEKGFVRINLLKRGNWICIIFTN